MTLRHRLEDLAFLAARAVWMLLPERAALSLGAGLGWFAGAVLRIRRADVDRHLAWAFPDRPASWRRRVARASYAHLGREAVVLFRGSGWSAQQVVARTRVVGFEPFREAALGRGGVVLLTGHLGNWELGGAAIAARGVPLDVVGKGMANRSFQNKLFAARERLGMRVVEMSDAPREALASLDAGRVVALLGDQNAHGGGVFIPFFGRAASTARGPALFAIRKGAPVFVAFALRDGTSGGAGRKADGAAGGGGGPAYTVSFERIPFEPTGAMDADVEALLRAYTKRLERAVSSAPEQYFWQHRRWKKRPAEELPSEGPVTI